MKKLLIITLSLLCAFAPACKKVNNESYCIDHKYVDRMIDEATCTENGLLEKTCSLCGDIQTETIEATGHTIVDGVCEICKQPCTHQYEEKVLEEATCKQEGQKAMVCKHCDHVDEETITAIPKGDHVYVDEVCKHCGKENEKSWTGFY